MSSAKCLSPKYGSDSDLVITKDKDAPCREAILTRQKRKRADDDISTLISSELKTFKTEILEMLQTWRSEDEGKHKKWESTLSEIKSTTQDLEKAMNFISTVHDEMCIRLNNIEQKTKVQDEVISALKNEVEHLQRESRKSVLEIRNVPVEPNENKTTLGTAVIALCKTIKSDVSASEIKGIYRIPGKRDAVKPLIVELTTKESKLSILTAAKNYNKSNKSVKLNASHMGLKQTTPIYVSDHLTPLANRLFFLARDLVKSQLFKYCWTTNGKIFVKKNDEASAVLIQSESQITQQKSA